MREKGGNHLVPGPDYMVDALKLPKQAPRGSAPKPKIAWIEVRRSERPQMTKKKLAADHTFFCEVISGIILFRNNDAHRCPVIEHVTGPPAPNSSKKYGPRIKDVENPHHTVTFGECSGTRKVECGLSVSQIRQL
ncbi:hypothetical protein TNCV_3951311 [Trichonephila clavipes]|nr:hypothetical protein TNCV_3951311 [Trichonephila clavipes]